MPTGYTADVESGKLTDFRTFALRCARNFGACIMQREDPLDVLPEHRAPSTYHSEGIKHATRDLARLQALTPAEVERECTERFQKQLQNFRESKSRILEENDRFNAMLEKVMNWDPPTPDHVNLKKFMVEQLEISAHAIDEKSYFFEEPKPERPGDWLAGMIEKAGRDIEYHAKHQREELESCAKSNAWIDALTESLKP